MPDEIRKTSLQDIAKTLVATPQDNTGSEEVDGDSPLQGTAIEEDLTTDDLEGDEGVTDDQVQDTTDEDDQEEDVGEADEEDDNVDQDQNILDIRDEDEIEVMIDGQLETRTIAELKKAISGEGAIERRLQEATEVRKTAHAERTTTLERLAEQERLVANSLTVLEDTIFKAVIPAPDPSMKDKNPGAYLRHKEAYDEDQKRIADGKKALQNKLTEFGQQRATRLKEYGEAAAKEISRLIPELVDPTKSAPMLESLVNTAKTYGYTEQEISSALDPRMFHLVRDAMLYRKLTNRAKETKVGDLSDQGKKAPRRLRSGNTRAVSQVQAAAKRQAETRAKAAQTGKVSDVAAMLLKPKGK